MQASPDTPGGPPPNADAGGGATKASSAAGRLGPFTVIVTAFVALLLISNVAATKLLQIPVGPWRLIFDGGALMFPLTYVLGDVLAEVYGWAKARRVILLGLVVSVAAALLFLLLQVLPPADGFENQAAYEAVLGFVPRIVVASLAAYLVGQLLNAYVLVWIKKRWGGQRLWVRLLGSSAVGEAADTLVFCTVAFYGVLTGAAFWNYVAVGYVYKMLVQVLLLPASYWLIRRVRSVEAAQAGSSGVEEGLEPEGNVGAP